MRAIILFLLCQFVLSCGGNSAIDEFVKPLRSDSKLAYTIKRFQTTTCKTACLDEDYLYDNCYDDYEVDPSEVQKQVEENPDFYYCQDENGNKIPDCINKCVTECPLQYTEFLCIDLQKEEGEKNKRYSIKPYEWQRDVKHLSGHYFHSQIKRLIAQPEFMCEQDLAACENHFEPIQALQKFLYEMEQ